MAASVGPLAASALGQTARQATPAATAAPAPVGLDALSEDAVMSQLSGMKLDSLLNREFEANHVPKERQDAIISLGALRELAASPTISNNRRIYLMKRAVDGLNSLLPSIHDPMVLMTYAGDLIAKGIEPDINTLEYWGENPTLQARLKPATDIASNMLVQVGDQADQQTKAMESTLRGADDPRAALYTKLDQLRQQAQYYVNYFAYYRAMSIDTSDGKNADAVKERTKICKKAIAVLEDPYDQQGADGGVQPLVHNRIGKLYMAEGEYAKAKVYFNAEMIGKTPDGRTIDPAPNPGQQYEAHYFSVLCDVLSKKADAAEKGLNDLVAWQKKSLPADAQSGVDAASDMLRYRMLLVKADAAKEADKEEINKQADAVLMALEKTHPEYTAIITEQLVNRLPESANLNEQGVSVLRALIAKGNAARLKPDTVPLDENDNKAINRAVAAARVFIKRTDVTPREAQETALLTGMLLDRQAKALDAANAYLDFARTYSVDSNAGAALDRAVSLAYTLYHGPQKDEGPVKVLYGKALAMATSPPWSRKEWAYYYADYLRTNGKPIESIAFYRLVPAGDKMEFSARFFELIAINDQLDDAKLTPAARQKDIAEAVALVDKIRQLSPSVAQTDTSKFRLAYSTLLGASFAIQQKDAAKALQLLANFNAEAAAVPKQSEQLLSRATFYRAQAYMADKKFDKATAEVIELSKKSPDAAKDLATSLLDQLGKDYDRQQANNQTVEMAETARNEAQLTDFMVKFCENSNDPKIKALVPDYQLYDAKMKLNAGNLAGPADRTQQLTLALDAYSRIKQARPDDTTAAFGMGQAQFALGKYGESSATLGTLLFGNKLGAPQIVETDKTTGEQRIKDNSAYWEAKYKWIKSNVEQAKALPNDATMQTVLAAAKQSLKDDFINNKDDTGGQKWATQYEALRQEILPDFDPHALIKTPTSGPTSAPAGPATQPVAGAGK